MDIFIFIIVLIVVYTFAMISLLFIIRVLINWYLKRYGTTKWRIDE